MADLRGGARDAPSPRGSKFFHFHAVFDQKKRLAHRLWELAPPSGKSRMRHCQYTGTLDKYRPCLMHRCRRHHREGFICPKTRYKLCLYYHKLSINTSCCRNQDLSTQSYSSPTLQYSNSGIAPNSL